MTDYDENFELSLIKNVKYLKLNDYKFANDVVFKPTELENLKKLEQISFLFADYNFISLLVRGLVNVKIIQITNYAAHLPINLIKLNTERKQLVGAKKLTIFVPEDNFLEVKWKTTYGETDLSHIILKRNN